jgi:hypothetical protein
MRVKMLDSLRNLVKSEHEWAEESLSAYIDGELSAKEMARIEKHLQECQACTENLATLRQTVALLKELPTLPAPRSFALRPAPVRPKARAAAPGWGYGLLKGATALAALLLVVLISGDLALRFLGGFRLAAPAPMAPAAEVALAPSASPSIAPLEAEEELVVGEGKTEETPAEEPPPPAAAPTEAPETYQAPSPEDTASPVSERVEGAEPEGTPTAAATPLGTPSTEDREIGAGPGEPVATPMLTTTATTTPSPMPGMEYAELTATPTPTATPEAVAMADIHEEEQARERADFRAESSLFSPLRLAELVVLSILLLLILATLLTGWLIRRQGP